MAKKGWSRPFEDPIILPDGRELITLKSAADYIMKLPKVEQKHEKWQTAIRCLIGAAEGRDFLMHARISVLRATHKDEPRSSVTGGITTGASASWRGIDVEGR
jgi:hypothetical protein